LYPNNTVAMNTSSSLAPSAAAPTGKFPAIGLTVAALGLSRGTHPVLDGLDLKIAPASVCLVRGPNGAGKSTLLAALAGLLRPTAGKLEWTGTDPEAHPLSHIHFVGHDPALKPALTVTENLEFWSRFYGGGPVAPALFACGLDRLAPIEVGHLSAGQKRRVGLARLLCAPRPVWLLDEPTATLDEKGQTLVATMIADHVGRGGTVVAATHHPIALPPGMTASTLDLKGD
jgi:heme exporter protein A